MCLRRHGFKVEVPLLKLYEYYVMDIWLMFMFMCLVCHVLKSLDYSLSLSLSLSLSISVSLLFFFFFFFWIYFIDIYLSSSFCYMIHLLFNSYCTMMRGVYMADFFLSYSYTCLVLVLSFFSFSYLQFIYPYLFPVNVPLFFFFFFCICLSLFFFPFFMTLA